MPIIDRLNQQEYFKRKYGADPWHEKDTRNLLNTDSIIPAFFSSHKTQQVFVFESLTSPITEITKTVIDTILEATKIILETDINNLQEMYPRRSIDVLFSNYYEMTFKDRGNATEFETVTKDIFKAVFGFVVHHVRAVHQ